MQHLTDFLDFAIERENIRLSREAGQPPPWTNDPVLQSYFFCNVFREDDKVTRWFRENIRDEVANDAHRSVLACTVFRWFNLIRSGEVLKPFLLNPELWDEEAILWELSEQDQVTGGAYMIRSPTGHRKAAGLLMNCRPVLEQAHDIGWASARLNWSLQELHERIMEFEFLGSFMAYEVVTDLRHTVVGRNADDINTWAAAGPGCARGLGWVVAHDPTTFSYGSARHQKAMLELMRDMLPVINQEWPWERKWEMREVEHVLCEFAKYRVAQTGGRVKRKYRYGV